MDTLALRVPGITCGHCVNSICRELSDLDGVRSAAGDPSTKAVVVDYELPATSGAILARLEEIGYPAER